MTFLSNPCYTADMEKLYTIKDVARLIGRGHHTAWHHIRKIGVGRMIGNQLLLTEDDVKKVTMQAHLNRRPKSDS